METTEMTLYHYGVKGMKWGIRKAKRTNDPKPRRHLGIDERGNLNLIKGKTSAKAKKLFATKLAISLGVTTLSMYIAKNPQVVVKGQKAVQDFLRKAKDVADTTPDDSGIYSKSLGRNLTIMEAWERGFDVAGL